MMEDIEDLTAKTGITQISSTVSVNNAREKIKRDDTATLNYSTVSEPTTQTASYIGKKENGTRVVAVVSGPVASGSNGVSTLQNSAEDACDAMAYSAYDSAHNWLNADDRANTKGVTDYAYLHISHAQNGAFEVSGRVGGKSTVIAFHPSVGFMTLEPDTKPQKIHETLLEGSIVLCLTGDILNWLPCVSGTNQIDFQSLFQTQKFELPSNLNESTLMTALANHAAKNKRKYNSDLDPPLDTLFVVSLSLSNELKLNPLFNPANVPAWLLALTVGVVFGLSLFAAPALLAAAASVLMPLVFSFAILTGATLIGYLGYGFFKDVFNQRDTRKLETPLTYGHGPQEEDTIRDLLGNYACGILPRIKAWVIEHWIQAIFSFAITAMMITLVTLTLCCIFDTTMPVGPVLQGIFNFIHTLSGLSQGTFLSFEVGSITSDVVIVLVAALIPTFVLNAIRQVFTWGYEKWKDESLSDVDIMMKEQNEIIKDAGTQNTLKEGSKTHVNKHSTTTSNENATYAFTNRGWTAYWDDGREPTILPNSYALMITSDRLPNGRYKAIMIDFPNGDRLEVNLKDLDKDTPVWHLPSNPPNKLGVKGYGDLKHFQKLEINAFHGLKQLPSPPNLLKDPFGSSRDDDSDFEDSPEEEIEQFDPLPNPNNAKVKQSWKFYNPKTKKYNPIPGAVTYALTKENFNFYNPKTKKNHGQEGATKLRIYSAVNENRRCLVEMISHNSEILAPPQSFFDSDPMAISFDDLDTNQEIWLVPNEDTDEERRQFAALKQGEGAPRPEGGTKLPFPIDNRPKISSSSSLQGMGIKDKAQATFSPIFHKLYPIDESESMFVVTEQDWKYRSSPDGAERGHHNCRMLKINRFDPNTNLYTAVRMNSEGILDNNIIYVHRMYLDEYSKVMKVTGQTGTSYQAAVQLRSRDTYDRLNLVTKGNNYALTELPKPHSGSDKITYLPTPPWSEQKTQTLNK